LKKKKKRISSKEKWSVGGAPRRETQKDKKASGGIGKAWLFSITRFALPPRKKRPNECC